MLSIFARSFSFFAISYFFPLLSTVILNLEAVVSWLSCLSDISKLMNGKITKMDLYPTRSYSVVVCWSLWKVRT